MEDKPSIEIFVNCSDSGCQKLDIRLEDSQITECKTGVSAAKGIAGDGIHDVSSPVEWEWIEGRSLSAQHHVKTGMVSCDLD